MEKNRRRNEQNKKRRLNHKNTNKDNKSKDSSNLFVNSLKNKSKKILNNKKKDKTEANTGSASKKKKNKKQRITVSPEFGLSSGLTNEVPPLVNHMNRREEETSSPPRLRLQQVVNEPQIEDFIDNNSSATDVDVNHSDSLDIHPVPEKSSAALCAQYLKACEGLSLRLSKYQFTEDELIASLKYFIVRQSLGDIERAANDIICGKTLYFC